MDANSKLAERLQEIKRQQMENQRGVDAESTMNEAIDHAEQNKPDDANESLGVTNDTLDDIMNLFDSNENKSEPQEDKKEKMTAKERSEIAAEKYAPIKITEKPKPVEAEDPRDVSNSLMKGLQDAEQEAAETSRRLHEKVNEAKSYELVENAEISKSENFSIDDIIESMGEQIDEPAEKEENIEDILKDYENNKAYSSYTSPEEVTGPADYIISRNEEYSDNVEEILKSNNIMVVKKNASEKTAILDRFVNSGDTITTTLPNSGIYVTVSGAGPTEIMDMIGVPTTNVDVRRELDKLQHVSQHIVGSSLGKMKIVQLIKVVSYWDKDSLFYALFAATHPENSELSTACDKCGREYYININTRDLLLNPEDFQKRSDDIMDNVTTYPRLLETSDLGKVYKKVHSNGMIIYYKHPSIESYFATARNLNADTMNKHYALVDLVYGIDKISIHVKDNKFIDITDPNEIIDIISKMKNADEKYEIYDMFENTRPSAIPVYGFRESVCPHCGAKNPQKTFSMESLLFTKAQQDEYEASLRWAVKTAKKRKELKRK